MVFARRHWLQRRYGNLIRGTIRRVLCFPLFVEWRMLCAVPVCWHWPFGFELWLLHVPLMDNSSSSSSSCSQDNLCWLAHKWSSQWTYISCVTRWVPRAPFSPISCFSIGPFLIRHPDCWPSTSTHSTFDCSLSITKEISMRVEIWWPRLLLPRTRPCLFPTLRIKVNTHRTFFDG